MMTAQEIYDEAIANGASPLFADLLASRQPPGTKGTDRAFLQDRMCGQQIAKLPPIIRKRFEDEAKKAGFKQINKPYVSALARFTGDTYAYVDDVADLKRKCLERGISGTGIIDVQSPTKAPKYTPLAEDIVAAEVDRTIAANPGKKLDLREVREAVIDRHAPEYTKKLAKESAHG